MRTDIFRPSVIEPSELSFVAFSYLKVEDLGSALFLREERERLNRHREMTGGRFSSHEHAGSCHCCGAHALYMAVFHHPKTNVYIKVGLTCAEALEMGDAEAFRRNVKSALEHGKGKKKAKALVGDAAWAVFEAIGSEPSKDEATVADIIDRTIKYGSISDKAMNYLGVLVDRIKRAPEVAAARAAEAAAAAPVPMTDARVKVTGEVLMTRVEDGFYGRVTKMLVRAPEGFKLFGNMPGGLGAKRGDEIEFFAKIVRSDKDEKFGFWSRPTKARVIKEAA